MVTSYTLHANPINVLHC